MHHRLNLPVQRLLLMAALRAARSLRNGNHLPDGGSQKRATVPTERLSARLKSALKCALKSALKRAEARVEERVKERVKEALQKALKKLSKALKALEERSKGNAILKKKRSKRLPKSSTNASKGAQNLYSRTRIPKRQSQNVYWGTRIPKHLFQHVYFKTPIPNNPFQNTFKYNPRGESAGT